MRPPELEKGCALCTSALLLERFDLILCQPFSQTPFDKLRAVVAADVFRGSVFIDQLRKDLLHFTGVDQLIRMNTLALPGILIHDIEHSQFASSLRRVMNKIPRPD